MFSYYYNFFFWLHWVFFLALRFSYPMDVGFSFLTRDGNCTLCVAGGFLTTGPPRKSPCSTIDLREVIKRKKSERMPSMQVS